LGKSGVFGWRVGVGVKWWVKEVEWRYVEGERGIWWVQTEEKRGAIAFNCGKKVRSLLGREGAKEEEKVGDGGVDVGGRGFNLNKEKFSEHRIDTDTRWSRLHQAAQRAIKEIWTEKAGGINCKATEHEASTRIK